MSVPPSRSNLPAYPTSNLSSSPIDSLLPPLLHAQDLDQPDEDVDKVELEADALLDGVPGDHAALGHAGVVQDLLDVVQGEATKDGQTTVQPEVLSPHQGAGSGGGQDQRGESRERNDGNTGEQGATEVEVLFLLGGGTDEGDGTLIRVSGGNLLKSFYAYHHSNSVQTSAGEEGRLHEEERRKQSSLRQVEGSPESILGNVAVDSQSCPPYILERQLTCLGGWPCSRT